MDDGYDDDMAPMQRMVVDGGVAPARAWWASCCVGLLAVALAVASAVLLVGCTRRAPSTGTTDGVAPTAPAIISPQGASWVGGAVSFVWTGVSDPSGVTYTLEVHSNSGFTSVVVMKSALAETRYSLQAGEVLHEGVFYWRVKAVDGAGNESIWASSSFAVDDRAPPVLRIISPSFGATLYDPTPGLDWSDAADAAGVVYALELRRADDFDRVLLAAVRLSRSEYALAEADALSLGEYYWLVKAVDGAGNSGPWTAGLFSLAGSGSGGPYIPHAIEGRDDCLACHGIYVMWPASTGHEGRENVTCKTCHLPLPGGADLVPHAIATHVQCDACHAAGALVDPPPGHSDRAVGTCLMCHEESRLLPPSMAHTALGRQECLSCHNDAVVGILPATHDGRTNPMCAACHDAPARVPPPASHSVAGRESCSACHAVGALAGLPPAHEGRADILCLGCHDTAVTLPPVIAHDIAGRGACFACHFPGALAGATPPSHDGRSNQMCLVCHDPTTVPAVRVPHTTEDHQPCTGCHGNVLPLPVSHLERTSNMCLVCHSVSAIMPPTAPHQQIGNCAMCHSSAGPLGALPATHDGRAEILCGMCHRFAP